MQVSRINAESRLAARILASRHFQLDVLVRNILLLEVHSGSCQQITHGVRSSKHTEQLSSSDAERQSNFHPPQ